MVELVRRVGALGVSSSVALAVLLVVAAISNGATASVSSATIFYCTEVTSAYTECPLYINYNVSDTEHVYGQRLRRAVVHGW
jgi:hypothetical protein